MKNRYVRSAVITFVVCAFVVIVVAYLSRNPVEWGATLLFSGLVTTLRTLVEYADVRLSAKK